MTQPLIFLFKKYAHRSLCSCHLISISTLLNEQSFSPVLSYLKIVFICLGENGSRTTFIIAHILPQQLTLFSETSATWGPIALRRTETTTSNSA